MAAGQLAKTIFMDGRCTDSGAAGISWNSPWIPRLDRRTLAGPHADRRGRRRWHASQLQLYEFRTARGQFALGKEDFARGLRQKSTCTSVSRLGRAAHNYFC